MRTRYRPSNTVPEEMLSCQCRSTRSRSSGWIASSQPLPRYSATVWPVIQRHSGESSATSPVGVVTQTTWSPACTSER